MEETISSDTWIEKEILDSFSVSLWDHYTVANQEVLRITYNRIFLIREGEGTLYIDGMAYPVSGNEIFLLAKGQLFSFAPYSTLSGYALCFGDCFWEKAPSSASNCKAVLFNHITQNQHLLLSPAAIQEFSFLFHTLFQEYSGADYPNKPDALAAYLKIMMIKIANLNASLTKAYNSYEHQLYDRFIALVREQFRSAHDVSVFAKQLNISPRKLSEICKQHCGKGPKDIIHAQIIAEAKRALQFTSKPVKEIAFGLNFATAEQFSHYFKKYTGSSPQLYRVSFVKIGM